MLSDEERWVEDELFQQYNDIVVSAHKRGISPERKEELLRLADDIRKQLGDRF